MKIREIYRLALMTLVACSASCGVTDVQPLQEGVVRFIQVEGGCWAIDTADERLEPIGLPEEFRVDGLAISFTEEARPELASVCQVGRVIEIESIRRSVLAGG